MKELSNADQSLSGPVRGLQKRKVECEYIRNIYGRCIYEMGFTISAFGSWAEVINNPIINCILGESVS